MEREIKMVEEFHFMTGNPVGVRPTLDPKEVSAELLLLRAHLVTEEASELVKWMQQRNIVETADACCDLIYVAIGTAVSLGFGHLLPALFAEVNASNMTKNLSFEAGETRAEGRRILTKGANYRPPKLASILLGKGDIEVPF